MRKCLFIKTLLVTLIPFFLLSGCATSKAEYNEAITHNIQFIQEWADYMDTTFSTDDFYTVFNMIIKFREQYREEKEVSLFADYFFYRFIDTHDYIPTKLAAIKSNAEYYITSYNTTINSGKIKKQERFYTDSLQFIQTINSFNEQLRGYGTALIELAALMEKYNFKYP